VAPVRAFGQRQCCWRLSGLVAMFDFIELLRRRRAIPEGQFRHGPARSRRLRLPLRVHADPAVRGAAGGILLLSGGLTPVSELIVARRPGISAWEFF